MPDLRVSINPRVIRPKGVVRNHIMSKRSNYVGKTIAGPMSEGQSKPSSLQPTLNEKLLDYGKL